MPIHISIDSVKDSFKTGFSLAKPVLDLLAERLDDARACNVGDYSNGFRNKNAPRVSIPALIERHGRFETAVMCAAVENMACVFLLRDQGVRGAIERTLPLVSTRARDTFDGACDFLIDRAHTLVDAIAGSLEDKAASSAVAHVGVHIVAACVDSGMRRVLGEDYVADAREYVKALPGHAVEFSKVKVVNVYVPCKVKVEKMKESSRLVSVLCEGMFQSSVFGVVGASIFLAFAHVYTISVEEQEEQTAIVSSPVSVPILVKTPAVIRISDWRSSGILFVHHAPEPMIVESSSFKSLVKLNLDKDEDDCIADGEHGDGNEADSEDNIDEISLSSTTDNESDDSTVNVSGDAIIVKGKIEEEIETEDVVVEVKVEFITEVDVAAEEARGAGGQGIFDDKDAKAEDKAGDVFDAAEVQVEDNILAEVQVMAAVEDIIIIVSDNKVEDVVTSHTYDQLKAQNTTTPIPTIVISLSNIDTITTANGNGSLNVSVSDNAEEVAATKVKSPVLDDDTYNKLFDAIVNDVPASASIFNLLPDDSYPEGCSLSDSTIDNIFNGKLDSDMLAAQEKEARAKALASNEVSSSTNEKIENTYHFNGEGRQVENPIATTFERVFVEEDEDEVVEFVYFGDYAQRMDSGDEEEDDVDYDPVMPDLGLLDTIEESPFEEEEAEGVLKCSESIDVEDLINNEVESLIVEEIALEDEDAESAPAGLSNDAADELSIAEKKEDNGFAQAEEETMALASVEENVDEEEEEVFMMVNDWPVDVEESSMRAQDASQIEIEQVHAALINDEAFEELDHAEVRFSSSMPCIASRGSVREALSLNTSVSFDCKPSTSMGSMNTAMSFMKQESPRMAEGAGVEEGKGKGPEAGNSISATAVVPYPKGGDFAASEGKGIATAASSKSTLTPTALPFVPRAHLRSAPAAGVENMPPMPAHWEPARTAVPVTIEAPRAPRRRTTQSSGRRARHLAHMGQGGKVKARILGDHDVNA